MPHLELTERPITTPRNRASVDVRQRILESAYTQGSFLHKVALVSTFNGPLDPDVVPLNAGLTVILGASLDTGEELLFGGPIEGFVTFGSLEYPVETTVGTVELADEFWKLLATGVLQQSIIPATANLGTEASASQSGVPEASRLDAAFSALMNQPSEPEEIHLDEHRPTLRHRRPRRR